jgi:hypothetical protein
MPPKPYTLAGFEPGSVGGRDDHYATPPAEIENKMLAPHRPISILSLARQHYRKG